MDYSNYVILNFDLGIRGEYDSLYIFLDTYKAKDCGNSNCFFEYNFHGTDLDYDDKFKQLKDDLEDKISISKNDRIYVIVHNEAGKPRGKFLFGQRKTPIWDGYAPKVDVDTLPF
ncbi:hypothetical protein [Flavobacterium sp.]|uniref:hypothetical protein n=1 Tax=Flavobacterium sp. TaxID=239 RepID=UPI0022C2A78B|nr:hypothetical protein [Flavobacterium sp.]MCZ8143779.1 hypothetical protein [Flavobacterium sp.]MCZ8367426.1 hypothetical protein [Flavobacterium sp.]